MALDRLRKLGLEAAERADSMGCAWSTQGGGMPGRTELDRSMVETLDVARAALDGAERAGALRALAAAALFAVVVEEVETPTVREPAARPMPWQPGGVPGAILEEPETSKR